MFGLIKNALISLSSFSGSIASLVNVADSTKCISLDKQPHITRPTLIKLNPDEYSQGFRYYLFKQLYGSYNTLDDLPNMI